MNSYHTNAKGSNKKTRVGWPRMNFTQKHVNKNKKKKKKKKQNNAKFGGFKFMSPLMVHWLLMQLYEIFLFGVQRKPINI